MNLFEEIIVIILGLILGSFLNVLIYRIPRGLSIIKPGSSCPECKTPIKWYDNIPVLSFIILGGKCRVCKKPISFRYPIVEIITSIALFLVYKKYLISFQFFGSVIFAFSLIVLAFIDLEHKILPDKITIPGFIFFLFYSLSNPYHFSNILSRKIIEILGGAIVGGGSLIFIYLLYYLIRKEEGLGFGDIKMMLMVGVFLGIVKTILTLVVASILGSITGLIIAIVMKKGMKYALPFGVFLSIGAFISLMWGNEIISFYWRLG
ncbi:MAG: prepilin peptidase [Candidatus Aminicenantia bacterium]